MRENVEELLLANREALERDGIVLNEEVGNFRLSRVPGSKHFPERTAAGGWREVRA